MSRLPAGKLADQPLLHGNSQRSTSSQNNLIELRQYVRALAAAKPACVCCMRLTDQRLAAAATASVAVRIHGLRGHIIPVHCLRNTNKVASDCLVVLNSTTLTSGASSNKRSAHKLLTWQRCELELGLLGSDPA